MGSISHHTTTYIAINNLGGRHIHLHVCKHANTHRDNGGQKQF